MKSLNNFPHHSKHDVERCTHSFPSDHINYQYFTNNEYDQIYGNLVHKTAVICSEVCEIGVGNVFGPYSVIGRPPQHKSSGTNGMIVIGNNNVFREFFSLQSPTEAKRNTIIGNNNYFMSNSVIHHDTYIEDDVIVCSGVNIAGFCTIMKGAYIGMGSAVHQFQVIGSFSLLGMNTTVVKRSKITPGHKFVGSPARKIGPNTLGLERNGVDKSKLNLEKKRYASLKLSHN